MTNTGARAQACAGGAAWMDGSGLPFHSVWWGPGQMKMPKQSLDPRKLTEQI